jgi:hypothetical protein
MHQRAILLLIAGAVGFYFGVPGHYLVLWGACICVGCAVAMFAGWMTLPRSAMVARPARESEFQISPRQFRSERFWSIDIPLALGTLAWLALAAPALHIIGRRQSPSSEDDTFLTLGAIAAIGMALHLAYHLAIGRRRIAPRLALTTDRPSLDEPFGMQVEIDAIQPTHIDACRARVRCYEHLLMHMGRFTHLVVRKHSEQIVELGKAIDVAPGRPFTASADVLLDSQSHLPTGKSGISMYPFYHWEIQIEIDGKSTATRIFPIELTVKFNGQSDNNKSLYNINLSA